jgi:hypothetical protein
MQSEEIPHDQWQSFLDDFSRRHVGEEVTIEILSDEFGDQVEATGQSLLGVTADPKDSEAPLIEVLVGDSVRANTNRIVRRPSHLRVAVGDDGSEQALQIESENEPTVLVRLGEPEFPGIYGA